MPTAALARVRITMRVVLLTSLALLAACGGPPPAKNGNDATAKDPSTSVGNDAVAQGGVSSLTDTVQGSGTEAAINGPIRFEQIDPQSPVKFDGLLKEWPASFNAKRIGAGGGATTFSVSLQYDDQKVYVGGTISDATPSHTKRMGESEDRVVLSLAFPNGGQLSAYDIAIYPGIPGDYAGSVKFAAWGKKGEEVPGAKIVEAPVQGGLSFEAAIPWSTFPEAATLRVGLRGSVRYLDYDGRALAATLSTGPGDAAHASALSSIPTEPEQAVLDHLLTQKGIPGEVPKIDLYADVVGDAMKERISVFGRLLTVCGPTYREGKQFFYRDLGGDLVRLDAKDTTGRGKDDLLIRRRFPLRGGVREWFEVLAFLQDEPSDVFSQEIAIANGGNRVSNDLQIRRKEIVVETEPAQGWDAASFNEPLSSNTNELLLPWATVKSRTYKFDGTRFVKATEVAQAPTAARGDVAAQTSGGTSGVPSQAALPRDVPTPEVKRGSDMSRELLALYRKDQSVPDTVRPKADLEVQVAEDARPERVLLIGKDIVVFGPGFRGGNQYAFLTLSQFADADDIAEMRARDLTGDGAADLVVRGARHLANAQGDKVDVDQMFVYEIRGGTIARIFAIETGRAQKDKRVQGMVQFVPSRSGKGFDVDVRPGLARGWTEKTFPWRQEQPGGGGTSASGSTSGPTSGSSSGAASGAGSSSTSAPGPSRIEPLLLPWGGISNVKYTYNGSEYAKSP